MAHNNKGFTLVELIIVIVIVGVLAAIAAPIMTGNVARARKTEAIAAFGAVRTAERLYRLESPVYGTFAQIGNYLNQGDLSGRYYSSTDYTITTAGAGNISMPLDGGCNMDFNTGTINGG